MRGYIVPFGKWTQWSAVPDWLERIPSHELSFPAKLLYARLCRYGGSKGVAFAKQATIAEAIGSTERSVKKYVAELARAKLIEVRRRGQGRPNEYRFLAHAWMVGEPSISSSEVRDPSHQEVRDPTDQDGLARALQESQSHVPTEPPIHRPTEVRDPAPPKEKNISHEPSPRGATEPAWLDGPLGVLVEEMDTYFGHQRHRAEAITVIDSLLADIDPRLIEEVVHDSIQKERMRRPAYVLKVAEDWAAQRGVVIRRFTQEPGRTAVGGRR
jgi:hypothetical protein